MNHDFYSPVWTQYRGRFAADVAALVRAVFRATGRGFERLSARQFDAPWRHRTRATRFSTFR